MIMKPTLRQRRTAFTLIEMIVVVVVVLILVTLFMPLSPRSAKPKARRIMCLNNLKEIGTAYGIWERDHGDFVPAQQLAANGGWKERLTNANQGPICWTNYALMTTELGLDPKLVVCPADERRPAKDFKTDFKDNTHLSYFVGVGANDTYPQSIAAGDRNLGSGTKPDPDYGYSPKSGQGNDVAIPITGPASWSLKMHSAGNPLGAGNILLGDGSAQQASSASFNQNWLRNDEDSGNWPAGRVPAKPSIRLVFP